MIFAYPKEYFFPIQIKECGELEFNAEVIDLNDLQRGEEEYTKTKILNEIDDEFANEILNKKI